MGSIEVDGAFFTYTFIAPNQVDARGYLESCAKLFMGSSLISKGSMFITKVQL